MSERIESLRLVLLGAAVMALALVAATAHAETIYVCWDGSGDYLTIQEGIDAAQDDDEVVVCDGVYTGPGNKNLDFAGKAITVRSATGPDNCVIDCEDDGRGFYFHSGESQDSVVNGFTVRNGTANLGAGICCWGASPTIANCIVTHCSASVGGGICCYGSADAKIVACTIKWNTATGSQRGGGGICCWGSSPIISRCLIAENLKTDAGSGGGAGVCCCDNANPIISACIIAGNIMTGVYGGGGGVLSDHSAPSVRDCTITGNSAPAGGGLVAAWGDPTFSNSTISGNVGDYFGGGGIDCTLSNPTITRCTIVGNQAVTGPYPGGGGIVMFAEPAIRSCTIAGNEAGIGGAIYCGTSSSPTLSNCTVAANGAQYGRALACESNQNPSVVEMTNCILWNGGDEIWNNDGSTITITYSDLQGGWPGDGNIDADPLFVAGPAGTWTLDGSYDSGAYQVTLTDADAAWDEDELARKLVNPDITHPLQFAIVTNTATTMTVWADWPTINRGNSWITAGMNYQVFDYHLMAPSPCVDAGDPNFAQQPDERDIDGQARVWDGNDDALPIIDMGSDEFGSRIPGDLDGDGCVNQADLGILLADWGCTGGDCPGDCDFDGDTDHADLGLLLGHWGEGCP